MPQPKKGPSLGASPSHERQMLSNLAQALFEHERIRTTEAKAKLLRPFAERLITKAKRGGVHHRRQVLATMQNRDIVHKLFSDIAARFSTRNGGYTRMIKLGPRNGDGAPMALVELVRSGGGAAPASRGEEPSRRGLRRSRRRRAQGPELPQDKPVRSSGAEAAAAGANLDRDQGETPAEAPGVDSGAETGVTERAQQRGDAGAHRSSGGGGHRGERS